MELKCVVKYAFACLAPAGRRHVKLCCNSTPSLYRVVLYIWDPRQHTWDLIVGGDMTWLPTGLPTAPHAARPWVLPEQPPSLPAEHILMKPTLFADSCKCCSVCKLHAHIAFKSVCFGRGRVDQPLRASPLAQLLPTQLCFTLHCRQEAVQRALHTSQKCMLLQLPSCKLHTNLPVFACKSIACTSMAPDDASDLIISLACCMKPIQMQRCMCWPLGACQKHS